MRKHSLIYILFNFSLTRIGYDMHLMISALARVGHKFRVIAKSKEKYLCLSVKFPGVKREVRFIDSLNFLNGTYFLTLFSGSLASLSSRLAPTDFFFLPASEQDLRFKQFFPYNYFTDSESNSIINILGEKEYQFFNKGCRQALRTGII